MAAVGLTSAFVHIVWRESWLFPSAVHMDFGLNS